MNLEDFRKNLQSTLPGVEIEYDNDGQIIIYTGLMVDDDGNVVDFKEDED